MTTMLAPTVAMSHLDIHVTFRLDAVHDHVRRNTISEAVKRTIEEFNRSFDLEHQTALAHKSFDHDGEADRLFRALEWRLQEATRMNAVVLERRRP